eukprot:11126232-Alexandrium_andersonii.AAC.1
MPCTSPCAATAEASTLLAGQLTKRCLASSSPRPHLRQRGSQTNAFALLVSVQIAPWRSLPRS